MATRFTIGCGSDRSFTVYSVDGHLTLYAPSDETLQSALGFETGSGLRGHMSRWKIVTVANDALKGVLCRKGLVRFVDYENLKRLLPTRLEDEALVGALADLDRAKLGPVAPMEHPPIDPLGVTPVLLKPHQLVPGESVEVPAIDPLEAMPVAPPPPMQRQPEGRSVLGALVDVPERDLLDVAPAVPPPPQPITTAEPPKITLPTQPDWLDDCYRVGKKYALAPHEMTKALEGELECYKKYWSDPHVPSRASEALSSDTVEKRVSRILLFYGWLKLIRAVNSENLSLGVCLNVEAIEMFLDWHQIARDTKLSNLVEYLSTFVSVGKFLGATDKVLDALRTIRNRLQAKERLSKKKTANDFRDDNRWLGNPPPISCAVFVRFLTFFFPRLARIQAVHCQAAERVRGEGGGRDWRGAQRRIEPIAPRFGNAATVRGFAIAIQGNPALGMDRVGQPQRDARETIGWAVRREEPSQHSYAASARERGVISWQLQDVPVQGSRRNRVSTRYLPGVLRYPSAFPRRWVQKDAGFKPKAPFRVC